MKVNLNKKVLNLYGKPIPMNGGDATLGLLLGEAYAMNYKDEELSPLQTQIRYEQALEFSKGGEYDFDDKTAKEAKELINKRFPLPVSGPTLSAFQVELDANLSKKKKGTEAA